MRRVGGIRDRKIDVRILAATNRDLEREAERERFRRDLYFRLAVILLHLPPLRERGEDILFLADHYLSRFRAKYGKDVTRLDPRARELLLAYPWPGNVRELSHVIERAVLWSRGPVLDIEHLSLSTPERPPTRAAPRRPTRRIPHPRRRRPWSRHPAAAGSGPGPVGAIDHRTGPAGGRGEPDPGGAAAGHLARYAAVPAQEVRDSGVRPSCHPERSDPFAPLRVTRERSLGENTQSGHIPQEIELRAPELPGHVVQLICCSQTYYTCRYNSVSRSGTTHALERASSGRAPIRLGAFTHQIPSRAAAARPTHTRRVVE